jgi:hypothetical protein
VLGLRRWLPLIPGALAAVLLGIAAVAAFGLDQHGVAIVGPIQSGLPSFGLPTGLVWHDYLALVGPAAGVLLVGFAEGLAAAKTYAARAGYDIDANRELTGLGVANLGAGLTSGMVVSATKTASGALTPSCARAWARTARATPRKRPWRTSGRRGPVSSRSSVLPGSSRSPWLLDAADSLGLRRSQSSRSGAARLQGGPCQRQSPHHAPSRFAK